jgi:DnaK suppressor protein
MLLASHVNRAATSTPDELSTLTRLETERVRMLDQLAGLRRAFQETIDASADSNADDEHDPEGSTIAFERSQLTSLIHQAEQHLDEIEEARMRMASRRYGLCETCGQPISAARLDARPVARTCSGCAASSGQESPSH